MCVAEVRLDGMRAEARRGGASRSKEFGLSEQQLATRISLCSYHGMLPWYATMVWAVRPLLTSLNSGNWNSLVDYCLRCGRPGEVLTFLERCGDVYWAPLAGSLTTCEGWHQL